MTRLVAALALLCALVGCAGTVPTAVAPSAPPPTSTAIVPAPAAVSIPTIGAFSGLIPLGLDDTGALAVPPVEQPWQASWFDLGVIPGEAGPAVIAGHVNGRVRGVSTPGVFARLGELVPGDEVLVERYGADPLRWRVDRVERHDKDEFPTAAVYGDTPGPELRLITCGGDLDETGRSYEDNVVVFAVPW